MHDTSLWRRLHTRAMLFSGWTWVAAASLIGFEALDIVFGAMILAPELLPLVIVALALAWFFRERMRRSAVRFRARRRLHRLRRSEPDAPTRPSVRSQPRKSSTRRVR